MFHPLAFTKTFALLGVALLSITLVPALIPIFLKGRLKSRGRELARADDDRDLQADARLADGPADARLLAVRRASSAWATSPRRRLGQRVHAALDEGSILDMPTTRPADVGHRRRRDDLKARDAVLRGFPEVWQVVGKAGRAETPTDPAPLDMVETIINLRDRELWPKRKLRFEDAAGARRGPCSPPSRRKGSSRRRRRSEERDGLVNEAAMAVVDRVDETLRDLARAAARRVPPGARAGARRRGDRCARSRGSTRRRRPASRPPAEREDARRSRWRRPTASGSRSSLGSTT